MSPEPAVPTPTGFAQTYLPDPADQAAAARLHALLQSADPLAPLPARNEWLEADGSWLRPRSQDDGPAATRRLALLARVLADVPAWGAAVAGVVCSVLRDASAYTFLCETGTGRVGFVGEAVDRVTRHVIPVPPDPRDLGATLARVFPDAASEAWLAGLRMADLDALRGLLPSEAVSPLRAALADTLRVAALRAAARGFADDLRARMGDALVSQSPFLALVPDVEALVAGSTDARERLLASIEGCRRDLRTVHADLEESGVSVDLVYRMELIETNLARLEQGATLFSPPANLHVAQAAAVMAADLLRQRRESRSIGGLVRSSTHLLARKIVERAGHTGEHYITATRAEHRAMLLSAAGGGTLTAFCILLKFTASSSLAPFWEGLWYAMVYGGGFLLMQAAGFTLATKQPSVTAAALAGALTRGGSDLQPLVLMIRRLCRSQLAAVMGNLGLVVPVGLALDGLWVLSTGHHFLPEEKAKYVLHSLDPLHSLTIPLAAFTGLVLWLGSLCGGWLENWIVYRRLPEAIAHDRTLVKVLGAARAGRIARGLLHQAAGVGSNVSLGVMLGFAVIAGRFFGLPLDVRHVTFSTGSLALAVAALGPGALAAGALPALAGVVCVGTLNLVVSFALALMVALRARDVARPQDLLPAVLAELRREPRPFFWPPAQDPPATAHDVAAA